MSGAKRLTPVEQWPKGNDHTINHNTTSSEIPNGVNRGLNDHTSIICSSANTNQTNQLTNQKPPYTLLHLQTTNDTTGSSIKAQKETNSGYEQVELKGHTACKEASTGIMSSDEQKTETNLPFEGDEDSEKKLSHRELQLNGTIDSTSSMSTNGSHTEEDWKLATELSSRPRKDNCSTSAARVVASLMIGLLFGFLLQRSSVYEPQAIRNQFLFENFTMVKVFFAALGTGQLVLILLSVIPLSKTKSYFKSTNEAYANSLKNKGVVSTLCGSALLGVGMAISGGCPGMVLAQIGTAVPNAAFTILGSLLGAFSYGLIADILLPLLKPKTPYKTYFIYELLKQKFFVLAIPSCILTITVAVLFEYFFPLAPTSQITQNTTSAEPFSEENIFSIQTWIPSLCGAFIGLLQLLLVLLIQDTLGSSSGYQTVTSVWLCTEKLREKFPYAAKFRTLNIENMWQVVFLTGAIGGSAISAAFSDSFMSPQGVNWYHGLVGGFFMLFGSRLAAGCTSGHGLSGTSLLIILSWLAVPGMFAGGIVTAFIMKYSHTLTYTSTWLG